MTTEGGILQSGVAHTYVISSTLQYTFHFPSTESTLNLSVDVEDNSS